MRKIQRVNLGSMRPGQDLVIAGYIGNGGIQLILQEAPQSLNSWFSQEYLNSILEDSNMLFIKEFDFWNSLGATECEASGEGGILKTLWDLSGAYERGISFTLRHLPIRQGTIEICEHLDLNPYRLYSKGCYLLVADNGGRLVENLVKEEIPAKVIGRVTATIAREVLSEEGCGFLERPQPDEVKKVIPGWPHCQTKGFL